MQEVPDECENKTNTINIKINYESKSNQSKLVQDKGAIKEDDYNIFIQELKILVSERNALLLGSTRRDSLTPPRINHRRFNESTQSARKSKRKVGHSKFMPRLVKLVKVKKTMSDKLKKKYPKLRKLTDGSKFKKNSSL